MLDQRNSCSTPSAIFLQASGSGATLSDKQVGPMIGPSGPDPAHANLSARQAKEQGLMTSGTYGQLFFGSFHSVNLITSLVNRLRVRTGLLGSTLYKLTWKERATPTGRLISALRASVRRTSDKDSGLLRSGWVTPSTRDWKDTPGMGLTRENSRGRVDQTPRQAAQAIGPIPTGWSLATGSRGQFNPAHSRWLMGLPPEWDDYAPTETPSSRKQPKKS